MVEAQAPPTQLLAKHTVLLAQIIDHPQLALVHPPASVINRKRKGSKTLGMWPNQSSRAAPAAEPEISEMETDPVFGLYDGTGNSITVLLQRQEDRLPATICLHRARPIAGYVSSRSKAYEGSTTS